MASANGTLSFESGQPCGGVPREWARDEGGKAAARFAQYAARGMEKGKALRASLRLDKDAALERVRRVWDCFRLAGGVSFRVEWNKTTSAKKSKRSVAEAVRPTAATSPDSDMLWARDGEPKRWAKPLAVATLVRMLAAGSVRCVGVGRSAKRSEEELYGWLEMVTLYQSPIGSQWKCPFVCYTAVESAPAVFDVDLYLNRLIFYLIADTGLQILMTVLAPPTPVAAPTCSLEAGPAVFTKSKEEPTEGAEAFSLAALLRSHESEGYRPYPGTPPGVALKLRDYQLQTLQWMLDQESLPRGLNGCLWERRLWHPDGIVPDASFYDDMGVVQPAAGKRTRRKGAGKTPNGPKAKAEPLAGAAGAKVEPDSKQPAADMPAEERAELASFYFSAELGELRLEEPPLVRGGLVCEEMGLGKTLEFLSLVMHSRGQPEPDFDAGGLMPSGASLFVVPDVLLPQWEAEIRKSLLRPEDVRAMTVLRVVERNKTAFKLRAHTDELGDFQTLPTSKYALPEGLVEQLAACDVVITNYSTVQRTHLLQEIHWRRVALDEMQEIRSSTTALARMCKALHARSRWMISGTPIYSGLDDLNGELAFLGVIPFCLADSQDGFWGLRIKQPFDRHEPEALRKLAILLDAVMMRHSKRQRYLDRPHLSILELPAVCTTYRGVPLSDAERATYAYVEVLCKHAIENAPDASAAGLQPHQRPGLAGVELLRRLAVSPALASVPQLNDFARRVTTLLRAQRSAANDPLVGMLQDEDDFRAMPGNELRDMLLSTPTTAAPRAGARSSSSGTSRKAYAVAKSAGAGAAGSAARENAMQRLEAAGEKREAADAQARARFCSRKGGKLPRRLWQWAVQSITSGKLLCALIFRGRWAEVAQVAARAPMALRRALELSRLVRELESARSAEALFAARREGTAPALLCEELASLEGQRGRFSFERDEDDGAQRGTTGFAVPREVLRLSFVDLPGSHVFAADPARWRRELVDRILAHDPAYGQAKQAREAAESRFKALPSAGLSRFPVSLSTRLLETAPGIPFEGRFAWPAQDGKEALCTRAWHAIAVERVDDETGCVVARFLDGTRCLLAPACVRVKPDRASKKASALAGQAADEALAQRLETQPHARVTDGPEHSEARNGPIDATIAAVAEDAKIGANSIASIKADAALKELTVLDAPVLTGARRENFERIFEAGAERRGDRLLGALSARILHRLVHDPLAKATPEAAPHKAIAAAADRLGGLAAASKEADGCWAAIGQALGLVDAKALAAVRWAAGHAAEHEERWVGNWAQQLRWVLQVKGAPQGTQPRAKADQALAPGSLVRFALGRGKPVRRQGKVEATDAALGSVKVRCTSPAKDKNRVLEVPLSALVAVNTALGKAKGKRARLEGTADPREEEEDEEDGELEEIEDNEDNEEDSDAESLRGAGAGKKRRRDGAKAAGTPPNRDAHASLRAAKARIDAMRDTIDKGKRDGASLRRYCALLRAALERGAANANVVEQQGFQALQMLVDKSGSPKCAICLDELCKPVCTMCIHLFCSGCLRQHIDASKLINGTVGPSAKKSKFPCPLCRRLLARSEVIRVEESTEDLVVASKGKKGQKKKAGSKGADQNAALQQGLDTSSLGDLAWFLAEDSARTFAMLKRTARGKRRAAMPALRHVGTEALNPDFACLLHHFAAAPAECAKFARVVRDLRELTEDGKCVVFSQFRGAVLALGAVLGATEMSFAQVVRGARQDALREAIDSFNRDDSVRVLLLQSSAAAAGLTLTVANHVLLLEPFLKAGEEAQAINRVHRIGQTREVTATVYFARGTVEERMLVWRRDEELKDDANATNDALTMLHAESDWSAQRGRGRRGYAATIGQRFLMFVAGCNQPCDSDADDSDFDAAAAADDDDDDSATSGSGSDVELISAQEVIDLDEEEEEHDLRSPDEPEVISLDSGSPVAGARSAS